MSADIRRIITDLLDYYDFDGQTVISVGAGGGQLVEYARKASCVYAVDCDRMALNRLCDSLLKLEFAYKFTLVCSGFYSLRIKGDVILFEFCLHEMQDARRAIEYALTLAPVVVLIDHWIDSEWAYVVDESEKVSLSWASMKDYLSDVRVCNTSQCFVDYDELYQKVKVQGGSVIERIAKYKHQVDFVIPMSYGIALIRR